MKQKDFPVKHFDVTREKVNVYVSFKKLLLPEELS